MLFIEKLILQEIKYYTLRRNWTMVEVEFRVLGNLYERKNSK